MSIILPNIIGAGSKAVMKFKIHNALELITDIYRTATTKTPGQLKARVVCSSCYKTLLELGLTLALVSRFSENKNNFLLLTFRFLPTKAVEELPVHG